jgi:hypothetical protein
MPNHHGPKMMNFVGPYCPAASVMQPGQQPTAGIFYPPPQQHGYFRWVGAGNCSNKVNNPVKLTPSHPPPTHNFAFAASVLLKTITTNAATIK